jgi:hypothetical protein
MNMPYSTASGWNQNRPTAGWGFDPFAKFYDFSNNVSDSASSIQHLTNISDSAPAASTSSTQQQPSLMLPNNHPSSLRST